MIRILHAADLHLDSPFQSLGREKALLRRQEQRLLLKRIAALAEERKVDIAVFSGDLFDSENAFSETAELVGEVLSSMPMPVFVAPGNHDWYGARSAWAKLSFNGNVHLFTGEEIACVLVPELDLRVWGTAFTSPYRTPPLRDFEAEKDGDTVDVLVLHGEVGAPNLTYGPVTEEQLARSGMDYVALGHVHSFSGLKKAGDTYYAWPGCPEGRGFDETGEKGVIIAEVEPGRCRLELVPTAERRYELLAVDLTGREDALSAIEGALERETSRDIYRIRLMGETDAAPNLQLLHRTLEGRFFSLEIRDETRLKRDIWAGRESDSLRGFFLARLWQQMEAAADEEERERITQAARWGLQALENGEELPL